MTETAQARMSVHDLYLFPQDDVPKNRKERKDRGEGAFPVDDEERYMVDLEAVGQVTHPGPPFVGVGDDDDLVAAVDELGRELVDVAFNAARLREEKVADHGDVVGHFDRGSNFM